MAMLTAAGLTALQQAMASPIEGADHPEPTVDEQLRLLAFLNPLLKELITTVAAGIGSSSIRAALFSLLVEDLARTTGQTQIVAAGKVEENSAHSLREDPLAQLSELHSDLDSFILGTSPLPANEYHLPGTKMLFKDASGFLQNQLHLSYSQAQHRISTRGLLLPRAGFNGTTIAPRFSELGKVFSSGAADPAHVATAAKGLLALQPGIDAQADPILAGVQIEQQVAESIVNRNATGTGHLLKQLSAQLDKSALERSEELMKENFGLTFKSKSNRGFLWEICTDVHGHEVLTSLADQIANPRTQSNEQKSAADPTDSTDLIGHQPTLPDVVDGSGQPEGATIPEWAIDPNIPLELRPRAGFNDVGIPVATKELNPAPALLPGESPSNARQRVNAGKLLQVFFDSLRQAFDGEVHHDVAMPMKHNVDLIVTISFDSLIGISDDPGISANGNLVSAGYARRMASAANVIPAVLGTKSEILDLGRTQRFFSRAQRRAMSLRDRGCINPGCSMAAHRCEANHIKPWFDGGKTDLSNGAMLCPICHASFHAGHFKIIVLNSIPYVLKNKALDSEQKLRRNWIFHPRAPSITQ